MLRAIIFSRWDRVEDATASLHEDLEKAQLASICSPFHWLAKQRQRKFASKQPENAFKSADFSPSTVTKFDISQTANGRRTSSLCRQLRTRDVNFMKVNFCNKDGEETENDFLPSDFSGEFCGVQFILLREVTFSWTLQDINRTKFQFLTCVNFPVDFWSLVCVFTRNGCNDKELWKPKTLCSWSTMRTGRTTSQGDLKLLP